MFSKLQGKATANSANNRFREFTEYVEGIKVSDFNKDIQETASEVIYTFLIGLKKY